MIILVIRQRDIVLLRLAWRRFCDVRLYPRPPGADTCAGATDQAPKLQSKLARVIQLENEEEFRDQRLHLVKMLCSTTRATPITNYLILMCWRPPIGSRINPSNTKSKRQGANEFSWMPQPLEASGVATLYTSTYPTRNSIIGSSCLYPPADSRSTVDPIVSDLDVDFVSA